MKNKRTANVVLGLSVGIFVSALLFFIVSAINNPNGLFGSLQSENEKLAIEEYLYYDIGSESAKLYISLEVPISQITVSCKPEEGQTKKFESKTNEISLSGLTPDTLYSCAAAISSETTNVSQSLGSFTTKNADYPKIANIKADAYDVSFNVVFRASWEAETSDFLITKSLLDSDSKVVSQQEEIISKAEYLDNKLEIGKVYQYEIRSMSGSTFGEAVIFKFVVEANERLEDIAPRENQGSLRILESDFEFNKNFSPKINVKSFSELDTKKYNSYVLLKNGIPILVDGLSGFEGLALAGTSNSDGFKAITLYETPVTKELQIMSATMVGKELNIKLSYHIEELSYYSPDGTLHKVKIDKLTSAAILDYEHPYIHIRINESFIKINQDSPESNIAYDPDSGLLSWDAAAHLKGFLLIISTIEGEEVYRVGTKSPKYSIDVLPNLDKIKVEIIGYPDFGTPLSLGEKIITLPENTESVSLRSLTLEKAGSSLALEWDGDMRNEYEIQISPRGKDVWKTISTVAPGDNSYILPGITKLNTGNYDLRMVPKRIDVIGKPYTYECYLKVDKDINYQIICE